MKGSLVPLTDLVGSGQFIMARPFEDNLSSQFTGSSLSSQTSLAANRMWTTTTTSGTSYPSSRLSDDGAQTWNPRRGVIKPPNANQGSRLGKIKSSSNHALVTTRKPSSHGRLHKRGNSASASQSPISSTLDVQHSSQFGFHDFTVPSIVHANSYTSPSADSVSKTKVLIKPLLRKLSSPDQNSIDLSRSVAENEGLGIYTSSDTGGGRGTGRAYHHRATSGDSQMSVVSSGANRFGTQYVHSMRQTPRPYTPTSVASYQHSLDGEISAGGSGLASSEARRFEPSSDTATSYAPLPTLRRLPPSLDFRTASLTHLANSSQNNLPGTPSSLRRQADYANGPDTMLSTGRSSLDSVFRRRNRANTDPTTQAATVAALRQKFNEKEAAKDLKYQQAEAKAQEKEAKKRERREEGERRKSDGIARKRAKSNNTTSEKSAMSYLSEPNFPPTDICHGETSFTRPGPPRRRPTETAGVAGKAVQSQWSLFWFNFKTVWLKLKRKMSRSST